MSKDDNQLIWLDNKGKMTKEDYMRLPKERLAEMLVARDNEPSISYIPFQSPRLQCYEPGGICTNPQMDCINCPRKFWDGGTTITTSQTILKEETECDNKKQEIVLPIKWTQDNIDDLTEFEAEMMHVGESFFGEYAGLNPNDTMSVRVQAKLLLELANKSKWTEEDERMLKEIISDVKFEGYNNDMQANSYKKIEWLKELKQRLNLTLI